MYVQGSVMAFVIVNIQIRHKFVIAQFDNENRTKNVVSNEFMSFTN
jgi:hypothetical protein